MSFLVKEIYELNLGDCISTIDFSDKGKYII